MTVSIFEREPYTSRGKARCIRARQTPSGMPRRLFSVDTDQKVGKPQERCTAGAGRCARVRQSCRTPLRRLLLTRTWPSYWSKPSFLDLFIEELEGRVT